MTSPRYAKLTAKLLSREHDAATRVPLALVQAPRSSTSRDGGITAVERAIQARAARRRFAQRAKLAAVGSVAIAAALAGLYVRPQREPARGAAISPPAAIAHPSGGGATLVAGGGESTPTAAVSMVEGQALTAGSRVIARPGGRALLAFATGTEITLEDDGDLTILDGGPTKTFALGAGAVRAKVADLAPEERFVVRTLDAEVEVRGTSFRVAVVPADPRCGDGVQTRIAVFEGTVAVRQGARETRVVAGEEWPAGCRSARAADVKPAPAVTKPSAKAADAPVSHAAPSTLAEQNDLFAQAVAAKRAGDAPAAVHRFEAFLARYPTSPLAESAAAQRMKLLREVDAARAIEAARGYLARWPNGFARAEAEAIATEGR